MTQLYGSNVPFDDFLPEVMQFMPDVPELIARNAVRNAAIEFCEKTRYWQIDINPISVVAGKNNYVIETPSGTKYVGMVNAYYDTNLMIPKGPDELASIYRMGDWQQVEGTPQYVTQIIKPEVILVPTPYQNKANCFHVRVAIAPTRDSDEISQDIYEQYLMVIANGAKGILYNTPGQSYFDRTAAKECQMYFRAGIANARIAIDKGLTRSSTRAEFQRFV